MRFACVEDEEAYLRAEMEVSSARLVPLALISASLVTMHTIFSVFILGSKDWEYGPLCNNVVFVLMAVFRKSIASSYAFRYATLFALTTTGCVRLLTATWTPIHENHPVPFCLLAIPLVGWFGILLGLRPIADCLPMSAITAGASWVHIYWCLHTKPSVFMNYLVVSVLYTCIGTAQQYQFDGDQRRRWLWSRLARASNTARLV